MAEIDGNRARLACHLVGQGVEMGPGHNPFVLPLPGVSVRYMDRWEPHTNRELFPELDQPSFPDPDFVVNFDEDRLSALADESQDFVICSHVLEHVAEPIGLLADISRVLRPGGVLLLLLPDRHRTFDRTRRATALQHLVDEHRAGVTEVDDDHVADFLLNTDSGVSPSQLSDEQQRRIVLDLHRRRSVHVHCWDEEEFFDVLVYTVAHLRQPWQFVDGVMTEDGGEASIEFGYVLRKSDSSLPPEILARRLVEAARIWRGRPRDAAPAPGVVGQLPTGDPPAPNDGERDALAAELARVTRELAIREGELAALRSTITFRYTSLPRRLYGALIRATGARRLTSDPPTPADRAGGTG